MNWPRYKFSKESEPELSEFFKAVAEQKSSTTTSDIKLWETILPVDETLQRRINSMKTTSINETINISDSDDENTINKDNASSQVYNNEKFLLPNQTFSQLTINESGLNTTTTEELIRVVQELLQTQSILSLDVIKQFGRECPPQRLQDMFTLFATDLNSECTLKLWRSINAANCIERNIVTSYFFQYILIPKILSKDDNAVKILFAEVLSVFPEDQIMILQKILFETNNFDLTILRSNLSSLPDKHKNDLLRVINDHCAKLEVQQLETVLSLITAHTDTENLNKLVELMYRVAKDFASEKSFGKLLLEVLQTISSRSKVVQYEQQLKYIISTHKSIFKMQIIKFFDSCLQDQKFFSQSFSI